MKCAKNDWRRACAAATTIENDIVNANFERSVDIFFNMLC